MHPPLTELADALRRLQRLRGSRRVHAAVAAAASADLSQQALTVLLALDGSPTVAGLARAAAMDVGAVSRQVRILADAGLVTKRIHPDRARVVLVTATPAGSRLARRVVERRDDHLARAVAGWDTVRIAELAVLLDRLVADLQATPLVPESTGSSPDR